MNVKEDKLNLKKFESIWTNLMMNIRNYSYTDLRKNKDKNLIKKKKKFKKSKRDRCHNKGNGQGKYKWAKRKGTKNQYFKKKARSRSSGKKFK